MKLKNWRYYASRRFSKDKEPTQSKIPGGYAKLNQYDASYLKDVPNMTFSELFDPTSDKKRALQYIKVDPSSPKYDIIKNKNLKPLNETENQKLIVAMGEENPKFTIGKYGAIKSDTGKELNSIKFTASNGNKGQVIEIPIDDLFIDQQNFFDYSGLGIPSQVGDVKQSNVGGGKLKEYIVIENKDGSLEWSPK